MLEGSRVPLGLACSRYSIRSACGFRGMVSLPEAMLGLIAVLLLQPATLAGQPSPPGQPSSGPGGSDYKHSAVAATKYGSGAREYWIFEPRPNPSEAPLIAFLHGWGGMDPGGYREWIDHIVKHGHIVVYPRYQENLRESIANMTDNAQEALKGALGKLDGGRHTKAGTDRFALVGHSLGGTIAMNLAGRFERAGLPEPRAVLSVAPGDSTSSGLFGKRLPSLLEPETYQRIPRETLVVIMAGDEDGVVGDEIARKLFRAIPRIPESNKAYVTVSSDRHGKPSLTADHFAPLAPGADADSPGRGVLRERLFRRRGARKGELNALDYYVYWAVFDALTDAAFTEGKIRRRDWRPERVVRGAWSDGRPLRLVE